MSLLENHLEQIALSSAAIAELPFLPPRIFTNALLHSHDITALIRDTEAHERALFGPKSQDSSSFTNSRRTTVHKSHYTSDAFNNDASLYRAPRCGSDMTTLLGIKLSEGIRNVATSTDVERGEIDVDILLKGAEKLCGIYPIPGALEKIRLLRTRYEKLCSSISHHELRVSTQTTQLARINRQKDEDGLIDEESDVEDTKIIPSASELHVTPEDLEREEEEIRGLEKKKRALEDRVSEMERDLGGLLR